ncbi:hypothetical protein [Kibdelosporangium persicum]|nr:hypothetical protein [Kibdelosporangium persicum]
MLDTSITPFLLVAAMSSRIGRGIWWRDVPPWLGFGHGGCDDGR